MMATAVKQLGRNFFCLKVVKSQYLMILLGVIYICHEVYILCFIILANEIASTVNQLWRNCLQENLFKKNCPVPPPNTP